MLAGRGPAALSVTYSDSPDPDLPMLIRIVRMTFRPDAVDEFLALFDASSPRIRRFDGCRHLELWQDADRPTVCTTYSLWTDEEALEAYRRSDLFVTTWQAAKALFDAAPEASSHTRIRQIDSAEAS